MSEQQEDPVGHAGAKVMSWVSLAAMAAEAVAQMTATRARERSSADLRTAAGMRAERQAAWASARLVWSPVLDPATRAVATAAGAGQAWAAAQPWRPDPEAERAAGLAEDRLRGLRPDVMGRYDRLRDQGVEPVDAMRQVAPQFDQPPAQAETAADQAHQAGRRSQAGSAAGGPRPPVVVAGDGYPKAITAGSLTATRQPPATGTPNRPPVAVAVQPAAPRRRRTR